MYYANGIGQLRTTGRTTSEAGLLRQRLWELGFSSDEINEIGKGGGIQAYRDAVADAEAGALSPEATDASDDSDNTWLWIGVGVGGLVLVGLIYMIVKG